MLLFYNKNQHECLNTLSIRWSIPTFPVFRSEFSSSKEFNLSYMNITGGYKGCPLCFGNKMKWVDYITWTNLDEIGFK